MHRRRPRVLVRALPALIVVACSSDAIVVSGGGVARKVPSGAPDASASVPSTSPGLPREPVAVACRGDGPGEAPDDAGSLDAGPDADAGTTNNDDDDDADPCATPPSPDCLDNATMVVYERGVCINSYCQFQEEVVKCPGGCFRQADGGKRCNE